MFNTGRRVMATSEATLAVRLPKELADELDQLARETGRSKSYYARQAIAAFLEDRADYLRAMAVLEREKGQPNLTLEQVKREFGLDDRVPAERPSRAS
jgi:RHH-type transcriptional regulator, rel operon repressor / antitoxin RelB